MQKHLLRKTLIKASLISTLFIGASQVHAQQKALNFDGVNDYIQTNFPGVLGTTARTVEAWVKTSTAAGEMLIADWGSDTTNGQRFTVRLVALTGGNYSVRVEVKGGGLNGTAVVNDGNWHHIAVTYDNSLSSNQYKIYVDGVLNVQGGVGLTANTVSSTNLIIGRRIVASFGGYFNGTIDDVRIWNVARTQANIQSSMNLEFCTAPSNLVAYYKMNDGTIGADNTALTSLVSSAGSYPGTFNGFALTGTTSNFVAGASNLGAPNNTISVSGTALTANQTGATYQWLDCNNANAPISGATSQSFTPTTSGNYAVTINIGGCSVTSTCQSFTTLGTDDYKNDTTELTVSPNPAQDFITINSKNMVDEVEIINFTGQRMMIFQPNTISPTFNISSLDSGVYIVKVRMNHQTKTYKMIKK
ncbi:LamG-like jellyroll fold domain-containing protein [Chryseobacterium gwangjuense]|uniref:LamG-like jellyroll fold domain-containing protein n=1 Tax=Chryseobacterium gwangjuense TaxID=1069980 RepID=UPI001E57CF54|nr:LamG-like jellyroll fold domain-containing protein [Chryseobacterium gwangjuense]MCE3076330.1 T9SS type A sorting domain-containing protein [Chryseobacterium gwangjuense]